MKRGGEKERGRERKRRKKERREEQERRGGEKDGCRKRRSDGEQGRRKFKGSYQSGQMGQTVNLLAYAFGGSNPSLPTRKKEKMPVGVAKSR